MPHYEKSTRPRQCNPRGLRAAAALILITALLGALPQPASAAAEVHGRADSIELRAASASIREILDALPADLRVTHRIAPNVSGVLTGQYSGSLYQVLARILDGYDYIVEISDEGIQIIVLGASGGSRSNPMITATDTTVPLAIPPQPLASYR
jgi:hypothetical protein